MSEEKPKSLLSDWRVRIFIIALLLSLVAIQPWYSTDEGFDTNLDYGLDLEGGSWLQVSLQGAVIQANVDSGMTASALVENIVGSPVEVVNVIPPSEGQSTTTISLKTQASVTQSQLNQLGLSDSSVSREGNLSEITLYTTEQQLIATYLSEELNAEVIPYAVPGGVEYEIRTKAEQENVENLLSDVGGFLLTDENGDKLYREGVRTETRDLTKEILSEKLNALGLKDIPVRTVGDEYILMDFAGIDLTTAKEIAQKPGKFEIRMQTEGNNTKHVLYGDDISSVGVPSRHDGQWYTPFKLTLDGANALQEAAIEAGAVNDPNSHWLYMYLDDEEVYGAPLSPSAASRIRTNPIYSWEASTGADNESKAQAEQLQIHLRAGALPVNVKLMGSGQVDASLGDQFKMQAIIAGLLSMLAVAGVVFRRYGKKQILVPMVATSVSEVLMILGFAAAVGWQLDLPSIAGIIAVIGTGIDHLVIITDEVLYEGKLPPTKVYLSRIARAFSIIFAAAATTIIAMSPLVVMGFGALKGFAITTIVGVLIGVLIARPVYGKVIKEVLQEKGEGQ
ncbi:preprotein translocase subunit SecD [Methanohalophilus profundi]|uniref:preprotein translocase subunit SecD n=1 Tax=Methanohalophilus profundi TaxID=2138083 RepID=UPI00101BFD4D|nr:preprotein translocase subunit SecD [Methanohalophilus profundi]